MSLYININNEALDNDREADREVVRRLKKNYIDNKEAIKPSVVLDTIQRNVVKKYFNLFERQIYKLIGYIEERKISPTKTFDISDVTDLISNVILAYNNIIAYLQNIKYNRLSQGDKTFIDKKFSDYISALKLVTSNLEDKIDSTILYPLSDIIENINLKNYTESGYSTSELVESAPRREMNQKISKIKQFTERYNSISKIRTIPIEQAKKIYFELSGDQVSTVKAAREGLIKIYNQYKAYQVEQQAEKNKVKAEKSRVLEEAAAAEAEPEEPEEPVEELDDDDQFL